jgi:hypothetical protein
MKVVLRNNQTGLYFQSPSEWASTAREAFDFLGTGQALQAVQDCRLDDVQVVLSFGQPQHDVVLPIKP